MNSSEEQQCIQVLRDLVNYLNLHHTPDTPSSPEINSLSDLKVELAPWSKNYFGNLLQPGFQQILDSFIAINSPHHGSILGKEAYMKALEFAYSREIRALQLCYDDENEKWGKTITKEEHCFLLGNATPLTNKNDIKKFVNSLMKKGKSAKSSVSTNPPPLPPKIKNVISKISPALLQDFERPPPPPEEKHKSKDAKTPAKKAKDDEKKEIKGKEASAKPLLVVSTRQKVKDMNELVSNSVPVLWKIVAASTESSSKDHDSEEGEILLGEFYQQLLTKDKQMLENLKLLNQKSKRFMKTIKLWTKGGFSQVYFFWINLILLSRKASSPTKEQQHALLKELYTDADDAMFALLIGQQQADSLHRLEFEKNYTAKDIVKKVQNTKSLDEEEALLGTSGSEEIAIDQNISKNHEQWKLYLSLVSQDRPSCRSNYKFLSIKLFMVLLKHKLIITTTTGNTILIDASSPCYHFLDTAFEIYNKKQGSSPPKPLGSYLQREERYATICTHILKGVKTVDHNEGAAKKPGWDLKWEAYWNLQTVLPSEHPLYNLILPPPIASTKKKDKASLSIPRDEGAKVVPNNHSLNLKTKERLYQWWLHRPFSNEDIVGFV